MNEDSKKGKLTSKTNEKAGKGFSFWFSAFFILGTVAGRGYLALPYAFLITGWTGLLLLIFLFLNSLYSAVCLGKCWSILEERYEEYRKKNRRPYASIAYRSFGKIMQYFVSFSLFVNLFGVSIIYLLLSSEIIVSMGEVIGLSYCNWITIFTVILCPLLWFGSPTDLVFVGVLSFTTTIVVCFALIVLIISEGTVPVTKYFSQTTLKNYALGFGVMSFSLGGAASYPTFQIDMADRNDFHKSATLAFALVLSLYLPIGILGFCAYGEKITTNILDSIAISAFKRIIEILLVLHMILTVPIIINPCLQEFEELFNIPDAFGWKRVVLRSSIMIFILFICLSIPDFGKVMTLIGGSSITLTTTVFPCLFYYRLTSQKSRSWPKKYVPYYEKFYLIIIIISGVVGGAVGTYAAVRNIVELQYFVPPCYINENK
ncbi:amino acid transporter AVT1E [Nephila pilipes]|uniref:Amino acid transporter AVT1E n=1 Tax=Nephila pilipes TaxID=299642 RepID=A0A8X6TYB8_NEPPI|nr:amino acid transporter AVT1E [Nephila pilipes]